MNTTQINQVAAAVVKFLLSLPVGTEISTGQALNKMFKSKVYFSDTECIKIDYTIRKNSQTLGLVLDNYCFNDTLVDLPFNVPYVILEKKRLKILH